MCFIEIFFGHHNSDSYSFNINDWEFTLSIFIRTFSFQSRGNRHTLIIRNVTLTDLGNYTCQASNTYGKDRALMTLNGIPSICEFIDTVRKKMIKMNLLIRNIKFFRSD